MPLRSGGIRLPASRDLWCPARCANAQFPRRTTRTGDSLGALAAGNPHRIVDKLRKTLLVAGIQALSQPITKSANFAALGVEPVCGFENALLDEVGAAGDAAGGCEARRHPSRTVGHGHCLSNVGR